MNLIQIETLSANLSFLSLFISVFVCWSKIIFPNVKSFGNIPIFFSNFFLTLLLALRWINSNHFPLSNLYESLIFLSWTFTFIHLLVEFINKIDFLAFIIAPTALLINAYATLSLPAEMQKSTPLIPALKSNWLMMHVTVMILSYAALIIGSLLAIGFLFFTNSKETNFEENLPKYTLFKDSLTKDFIVLPSQTSFSLSETIDNLSYRILGFGFILLTLGIISGAVWANEAWGSYWSWDPKETWAFITWLVFGLYLHTRLIKGWTGRRPALVAAIGFVIVWVCYLGVNLLGKGLHSYGWLS